MKKIIFFLAFFAFLFIFKQSVGAQCAGTTVANFICDAVGVSGAGIVNCSGANDWLRTETKCCVVVRHECNELTGECLDVPYYSVYIYSQSCYSADCCQNGQIVAGHCDEFVGGTCWFGGKYKTCCKNDGSGQEAACSASGSCPSQYGTNLCPPGYYVTAPGVTTCTASSPTAVPTSPPSCGTRTCYRCNPWCESYSTTDLNADCSCKTNCDACPQATATPLPTSTPTPVFPNCSNFTISNTCPLPGEQVTLNQVETNVDALKRRYTYDGSGIWTDFGSLTKGLYSWNAPATEGKIHIAAQACNNTSGTMCQWQGDIVRQSDCVKTGEYTPATSCSGCIIYNVGVCGLPSAPTSLAGSQSGNNINFTWMDNSSNEEAFELYKDGGASPVCVFAANTTSGSCACPDNASHSYTLKARRDCSSLADGCLGVKKRSNSSNSFFFQCASPTLTPTVCPIPPAPTGLSCNIAQDKISWNAVPQATYYRLRVDDRIDGWSGSCSTTSLPDVCDDNVLETQYDYDFQAGHSYSIWVHASNVCGNSSSASVSCSVPSASVTPSATSTPTLSLTPAPSSIPEPCSVAAPSDYTAQRLDDNFVALSFIDNADGELGFNIQRRSGETCDSLGSWEDWYAREANSGTGLVDWPDDSGADSGRCWQWRVQSFKLECASDWVESNVVPPSESTTATATPTSSDTLTPILTSTLTPTPTIAPQTCTPQSYCQAIGYSFTQNGDYTNANFSILPDRSVFLKCTQSGGPLESWNWAAWKDSLVVAGYGYNRVINGETKWGEWTTSNISLGWDFDWGYLPRYELVSFSAPTRTNTWLLDGIWTKLSWTAGGSGEINVGMRDEVTQSEIFNAGSYPYYTYGQAATGKDVWWDIGARDLIEPVLKPDNSYKISVRVRYGGVTGYWWNSAFPNYYNAYLLYARPNIESKFYLPSGSEGTDSINVRWRAPAPESVVSGDQFAIRANPWNSKCGWAWWGNEIRATIADFGTIGLQVYEDGVKKDCSSNFNVLMEDDQSFSCKENSTEWKKLAYSPGTYSGNALSLLSNYEIQSWQILDENGNEIDRGTGNPLSVNVIKDKERIIRLNVVAVASPWWQTKGGDVHSQKKITDLLPLGKYLSLPGDLDGQPGVVSFGEDLNPPGLSLSVKNWQAKTKYAGPVVNFDYLVNRLNIERKESAFDGTMPSSPEKPTEIIYSQRAATLTGSWTLPSGKKIIVFIDSEDDTKVKSNIIVPIGSFFALIAKGNIIFEGEVTRADGFFLSNKTISVATSLVKETFVGQGSFVGWEGVSLSRDLGNSNFTTPGSLIIFRPDFYIYAPKEFRYAPSFFEELPP